MKTSKKIMALLLALILLVSMVPTVAMATESNVGQPLPGIEMITGGDFEEGNKAFFLHTGYAANGTLTWQETGGVNDSACMALTALDVNNNVCMMASNMPVTKGNVYAISADVKVPENLLEYSVVDFEEWNDSAVFEHVTPNGKWQHLETVFIATSTRTYNLRVKGNTLDENRDVSEPILIDNVSMRDVSEIYKGVNLLSNSDFEQSGWAHLREDWHKNGGGRFDWSATGGVDGSGCWVGTPGTSGNTMLWLCPKDDIVTLENGLWYELSAKVYCEDTNALVALGPRVGDSFMDLGASTPVATEDGKWVTISYRFKMSQATRTSNFMVRANGYTTGTVKVDDVALRQIGVKEDFEIIKFNGATIIGITDTFVTAQLNFGGKVWLKGNTFLCDQKITSGCGDGTGTGYQYPASILIPGSDAEIRDEQAYASTWTVQFNVADCHANHDHYASLWGDEKPSNCVVRITDWFGEGQSNLVQADRMVLDAKAVVGIDGQLVAAEYVDKGMDIAWVDAQDLADVEGEFALQADVTTNTLTVPSDVVLDLNGYTVTAENLVSYGNIVDSSKGEALIKVSGHKEIRRDNSAMALYDAGADGYRFFDYTTESLKKDVDDNTKKFGVRMLFNEAKAYELLAASDNANTAVKMFIDIDGTTYEYIFNSAILTEYAQKAGAKLGVASDTKVTLVLTVTGYEKVVGKTVTVSGAYGSTTGVASDFAY